MILKRTMALLACMATTNALSDDGLVRLKSTHDVEQTTDRLINALESRGMTVFARVDHASGAHSVGLTLQPTTVVIFGNPKIGTRLMQCAQTTAIDLPQKALIWQDDAGATWLAYNNPKYIARRHGAGSCDDVVQKISTALAGFANAATQP